MTIFEPPKAKKEKMNLSKTIIGILLFISIVMSKIERTPELKNELNSLIKSSSVFLVPILTQNYTLINLIRK